MPAHKNDTKTFSELEYDEEARSINAQINNLKSQLLAHKRTADSLGKENHTEKFLVHLEKIISELRS